MIHKLYLRMLNFFEIFITVFCILMIHIGMKQNAVFELQITVVQAIFITVE